LILSSAFLPKVPIIMFWRRVSAETVETNKPVSTDNP
jgi:hypothetical protein